MPVRHQQGDLIVEAHSQELHPSLLEFSSNDALYSDGPGIKLKKGDDVQVTNLITQFNGREANSGSCLAFAPRNKNGAQVGNHQEATKGDWTAATKDDFVQLEPWAVPCDNTWMKERGSLITRACWPMIEASIQRFPQTSAASMCRFTCCRGDGKAEARDYVEPNTGFVQVQPKLHSSRSKSESEYG